MYFWRRKTVGTMKGKIRICMVLVLIMGSWPGLFTVEAASGDLVVDGTQITLDGSYVYDNVIIKNGGKIVVGPSGHLELTVANTFLVDATSAVVANALCSGPGDAPVYSGGYLYAGGGGAGHGGNGGQGDGWIGQGGGGPGGASYGDPANGGALAGSRGANGKDPIGGGGKGGLGGGSVIVRASIIQVAGSIQANGGNGGSYATGGGGGSGGGITLAADRVIIYGSVTANGGDGGPGPYGGGGGGGGRITILYGFLDNSGTVAANGGKGGPSWWRWPNWRNKGDDGSMGSVVFICVDKTPPTTEALLSGTTGLNGWYTSEVQVTLSASDNPGGTGVAQTEYSFDGTTWTPYTATLTLATEGITTIFYRSADRAGNVETIKTQNIRLIRRLP